MTPTKSINRLYLVVLLGSLLISSVAYSLLVDDANAQSSGPDGKLRSYQKISDAANSLGGVLTDGSRFGSAVTGIGDLDGDGVRDIAVGAPGQITTDAADKRGAVWILFLKKNGKLKAQHKITATTSGVDAGSESYDYFGHSLANIGDLNGDGTADLAVGVPFANAGGIGKGAVWILFLNKDGTVKGRQAISATAGGLVGPLDNEDFFGSAVAMLGDLDGDGRTELAVGASGDDDGGEDSNRGAIWLLYLNADGTVKSERKLSDTKGGFGGQLQDFDQLGQSLTTLGDLNGDGIPELASGISRLEDPDNLGQGALWIIYLTNIGTVRSQQEISVLSGKFGAGPSSGARYGSALAGVGDRDGDGMPDIAVGAHGNRDDAKNKNRGAIWILNLRKDGLVKDAGRLTTKTEALRGDLKNNDQFAWSVANLGDLDGDRKIDLAIGAPGDDTAGDDRGAVWLAILK